MTRLKLSIFAASLAGIAVSAGAVAQTTPQTTQAPGMTHQAAVSPASPALPSSMSAKVDQRIRQLHDQLQITAAEQPQWDQFAQVMRDNAAQMERVLTRRGATVATADAAANMQSYAGLAQVHATNMQKLASAFQSLYASFPDRQKHIADEVFRDADQSRQK